MTNVSKLVAKFVVVLAVLVGTFVALAPSADAAPVAPVQQAGTCVVPTTITEPEEESNIAQHRHYLPLSRWGDSAAGALHTRLGAGAHQDLRQKVSRDVISSTSLTLGNAFWQIGSGLVEAATRFDLLDSVGCEADKAAAKIGGAVMRSGLLTAIAALGVVMLLWRAGTQPGGGAGAGRKVGQMLLVLALFGVMLSGAQRTAETGVISRGSPAWAATKVNDIVSTFASAPAEALSIDDSGISRRDARSADPMTCRAYVAALKDRYRSGIGGGVDSMQGAVPLVMSSMWEESGLTVWIAVQFGAGNYDNSGFGNHVYCRLAERNAGISAAEQQALMFGTDGKASASPGTLIAGSMGAPRNYQGGNNKEIDRRTIGWAACRWSGSGWTVRPGWGTGSISDSEAMTPADCASWWESNSDLGNSHRTDWADNPGHIEDHVSDPRTREFLLNFHGDVVSSAVTISIVYVVVSFIIMIVFGLLGLGVIIAKVAGVVMAMMLMLVLTMSLWPGRADDAKVAKFAKFYAGLTLYAFGLQLVLALVATVTRFIHASGVAAFGSGSILSILWLGFAPITAIIVLHLVFKHGLGAPSPFKPSSALAWGGAMAGGAALGVGVDRFMNRGKGAARSAVRRAGRASRRAGHSITATGAGGVAGRVLGNAQRMKPGKDELSRRERWKAEADRKREKANAKKVTSGTAPGAGDRTKVETDRTKPGVAGKVNVSRNRRIADLKLGETARDFARSRNWSRIAAGAAAGVAWAGPVGMASAGVLAATKLAGAGAAVANTIGAPVLAAGAGRVAATVGVGALARYALRGSERQRNVRDAAIGDALDRKRAQSARADSIPTSAGEGARSGRAGSRNVDDRIVQVSEAQLRAIEALTRELNKQNRQKG